MEMSLGVLADYANTSNEGKLNIMGVFDILGANKFPARHPIITLVLKIRAGLQDAVTHPRSMQIKLVNENSNEILNIAGELRFQEVPAGELPETPLIMTFQDLVFKEPGSYNFEIHVAGTCLGRIPLKVIQAPLPSLA